MGETQKQEVVSDEEAYLFAMQLSGASAVPMVLKSALELGILETIAKAGPGAHLSPYHIVSQIPTIKNPEAPAMLDRLLRLLASFNILTCQVTPMPVAHAAAAAAADGNNNNNNNNNNHKEAAAAEITTRHYGLAPLAKYFVSNEHGVSLAAPFLMQQDKVLKDMWYHLTDSIREGGLPFDNCYGMNSFEFHSTDPRSNEIFNKAMRDHSSIVMQKIIETYTGFEGLRSVVDVGGGTGAVISMIVSKYPTIKGINFDLPHVVREAPSYPGVEHVGGDMFVSVPKGDAMFMKWICHDWNDEQCVKFLKNCYDSLPETGGKVILVECIVPPAPESSSRARSVFQMDVIILCHSSGGRERTEKEYEALAKGAGFQGFRVACCALNMHVLEFLKKP